MWEGKFPVLTSEGPPPLSWKTGIARNLTSCLCSSYETLGEGYFFVSAVRRCFGLPTKKRKRLEQKVFSGVITWSRQPRQENYRGSPLIVIDACVYARIFPPLNASCRGQNSHAGRGKNLINCMVLVPLLEIWEGGGRSRGGLI